MIKSATIIDTELTMNLNLILAPITSGDNKFRIKVKAMYSNFCVETSRENWISKPTMCRSRKLIFTTKCIKKPKKMETPKITMAKQVRNCNYCELVSKFSSSISKSVSSSSLSYYF